MRTLITVAALTGPQWEWLAKHLKTSYQFESYQARVCVTFHYRALERHVEMPADTLAALVSGLHSFSVAEAVLTPDVLADPAACGYHNPPHLYDCRATPEQIAEKLTGDKPSWPAPDKVRVEWSDEDDDLLDSIDENPSREKPGATEL